MTVEMLREHLSKLIGHVTFEYNGYSCGVDPLAINAYDMWYGDKDITVDSVDEIMNEKFFDGKSLKDIWDDVRALDF